MADQPPAARVIWEPPNRSLAAELHRTGMYHAAPAAPIEDGLTPREPGVPLCSHRNPLAEPPEGFLPPQVTCALCQYQINRLGITVIGSWSA
jgi:hypothetical protein